MRHRGRSRPSQARPWQLTTAERLAERLHPRKMAARRAESLLIPFDGPNGDPVAPIQGVVDVIDGRRDPHLFLPHEVFQALTTGLSSDLALRGNQRAYYRAAIQAFGWNDEELWTALEDVSEPFIRLRYFTAPDGRSDEAMCQARHDALQAARQRFGRAEFDRFRYTVIAPSQRQSTASTDIETYRARILRREDGCR